MAKQKYNEVKLGTHSIRRDYSKVSGALELPNLVEIQTKSFDNFLKSGIKEVFEEIFPISNFDEDIQLKFIDYSFKEPTFTVEEARYRQCSYTAPLYATLELEINDKQTGEIITRTEEVFFGDFPIMTEAGTFIINGGERVIVSQIVRSPGAYFDMPIDEKTGQDTYYGELIPARGTWLEFFSNEKKTQSGRHINVSVDRKRQIISTILLKTIGISLNPEKNEDLFDTTSIKTFLKSLGYEIFDDAINPNKERELLNVYETIYSSLFGPYQEMLTSLFIDKTVSTQDALVEMYRNQKPDEVANKDGSKLLMNQKFFDKKRYDLNKAGRYKLSKKLGIVERLENHVIAQDVFDLEGKKLVKKGTLVDKNIRNILSDYLKKGSNMEAFPFIHGFSHPKSVEIDIDENTTLVGRILSKDIETKSLNMYEGTIITEQDANKISKHLKKVSIYGGIVAKQVKLTDENFNSVFNYGQRLYVVGRICDQNGKDIEIDNATIIDGYHPNQDLYAVLKDQQKVLHEKVIAKKDIYVWLVGSANQVIKAYHPENNDQVVRLIGVDPFNFKNCITMSDMIAFYSYTLNMIDGFGNVDDIDMLGNRRVRSVGELVQNQYRIGLTRIEKNTKDRMSLVDRTVATPKSLINGKSLVASVREFFNQSQLSQFMDQENPLSELTNKRRISALGPGGLTRERAGFEVRDVHNSHYGRICPIETPEGQNIGLISCITNYAKVNEYGFIETPYRKVDAKANVLEEYVYLAADEEKDFIIAQANEVKDGKLINDKIVARKNGDTILVDKHEVDLADVSPKQIVSTAASCIPFLENDDCTRALMGANMQRQAVPLLKPNSPFVGTGIESSVGRYAGTNVICKNDGTVTYADGSRIVVKTKNGEDEYKLIKFKRSNAGTCINQLPIVSVGEKVLKGSVIADGPSMQDGELALGQNVTIAFMTWHGYNYEDAIIISEKLVSEDVYTSIHIDEYSIACRKTKLGEEEITCDIPNVSETATRHLDGRGIAMIGAEVKEGDILVGKVSPKGQVDISAEEKLLLAIFGEKSHDVKDTSLRVPHGGAGIVQDVKILKRSQGYDLEPGVSQVIKVYIVQKRKIHEGDKMAGRHGNKGVISKILPVEDMPIMPDGRPIDIMLNPFGVPSRMNIGQVLEIHLGMAAKKLNTKFATPVFDGISNEELKQIMEEAKVSSDGKLVLRDGKTGEAYDERISVGVMYYLKLAHMVDDKLHSRSTGPYSVITQQPLGGKSQNGGQRFGEMEVWALEAYGASHTLSEILTVKSDDVFGRAKTYEAIIKGHDFPEPGLPESFNVLKNELQGLALNIDMLDSQGNKVELLKSDDTSIVNSGSSQMTLEEIKQSAMIDNVFDNIDEAEAAASIAIDDEE